jgi:putative SbcD/Mre11-related phosphoesterase
VADASGALWLPQSNCLVVADLHLGYAWVQRQRGLMLPVGTPDTTVERLVALQSTYCPEAIVFLGDLVHAASGLEPLREHLSELTDVLAPKSRLICLLGNHDRNLARRVAEWSLPLELAARLRLGPFCLAHGDVLPEGGFSPDTIWVIGHEHPCIVMGDGTGNALRVRCFLAGATCLVLPAFSPWASGCVVGQRPFLGPVAAAHSYDRVVACLGHRVLSVPTARLLGGGVG